MRFRTSPSVSPNRLSACRACAQGPPTGAQLHTQDDIGHESRSEKVLPKTVRLAHEWAASLLLLEGTAEQLLRALQLQSGLTLPKDVHDDDRVNVHVHELYLSIAAVVGLIDDGARPDSNMPLHTGRYVRVTVANGRKRLATMWLPSVPVFRVSPSLMA